MSSVTVKENETLDSALRRFKRNCAKAGIQQEIRKREHYEKPSVKRKKKSEAARKRKYNYSVVNVVINETPERKRRGFCYSGQNAWSFCLL